MLIVLPALVVAQNLIPPIACCDHDDCTYTYVETLAQCENSVCTPVKNRICKARNVCGPGWGCSFGKCVLGGLGSTCRPHSANCMPGFTCDASALKCVRSGAGAVCRDRWDDCGFGHACFLKGKNKVGDCKIGSEGTTACRRNMQCVGPLRCYHFSFEKHACGRPADLPTKSARTFGTCETDGGCRFGDSEARLDCIDGKCYNHNLGQPCKFAFQCGYYSFCEKGRCMAQVWQDCRARRPG